MPRGRVADETIHFESSANETMDSDCNHQHATQWRKHSCERHYLKLSSSTVTRILETKILPLLVLVLVLVLALVLMLVLVLLLVLFVLVRNLRGPNDAQSDPCEAPATPRAAPARPQGLATGRDSCASKLPHVICYNIGSCDVPITSILLLLLLLHLFFTIHISLRTAMLVTRCNRHAGLRKDQETQLAQRMRRCACRRGAANRADVLCKLGVP